MSRAPPIFDEGIKIEVDDKALWARACALQVKRMREERYGPGKVQYEPQP